MTEFIGLGIALKYDAPSMVTVGIGVAVGVTILSYLGSYFYFMFKNPDALRSERFSLSKMAIEKSVHGDSLVGLIASSQGLDDHLLSGGAPSPNSESTP